MAYEGLIAEQVWVEGHEGDASTLTWRVPWVLARFRP